MKSHKVKTKRTEGESIRNWSITILLSLIPIVNIILLFIWASSNKESNSYRKVWAKSQLPITALLYIVTVFSCAYLSTYMQNRIDEVKEEKEYVQLILDSTESNDGTAYYYDSMPKE